MTSIAARWPESVTRWMTEPPTEGSAPRVAPPSPDAVAQFLATCAEEGWRVALAGHSGWTTPSDRTDLILSTRRLTDGERITPSDLVATVPAGARLADFQHRLTDRNVWLPIDPPGGSRSVGSVVATASSGGLAAGFGAVREQVLGMTVVTGDGRILRPGGRVVKNVAGFDLSRLMTGAFGAYGVISALHLRLRARPEVDETVFVRGDRDELIGVHESLRRNHVLADALTLAGRDARWTLAARITGSASRLRAALDLLQTLENGVQRVDAPRAAGWWAEQASAALAAATTVRIGVVSTDLSRALTLIADARPAHVAAHLGANTVRIATDVSPEQLAACRTAVLAAGMTWTVERGRPDTTRRLGHYPDPPPEQQPILHRLRETFDPHGVLVSSLFAA